jgi:predicted HTH transcriptional regulator
VVAFADSVPMGSSAVLFIGVTDEGRIVGTKNSDALQKTVRQVCEKKCYPRVEATISALSVPLDDGSAVVVAVEVPASTRGPHFLGPACVRIGAETVKLQDEEYDELFTRRLTKARQLLDWKLQTIAVIVHGKKLGSTERVSPDYRARYECTVE